MITVELVARCSEAAKHLKPVIELLPVWPRADRPALVSRIPTAVERRLGRAGVAELIYGYGAGESTRQLATRFGIAKTSVIEVLRHQGIKLRPRGSVRTK